MADKDFFGGPLKEGFYRSQKTDELYVFYKDNDGNLLYDNAGLATHYNIENEADKVSELPGDLELRVFQPALKIESLEFLIKWIKSKSEKLSQSSNFNIEQSTILLMPGNTGSNPQKS